MYPHRGCSRYGFWDVGWRLSFTLLIALLGGDLEHILYHSGESFDRCVCCYQFSPCEVTVYFDPFYVAFLCCRVT